MNEFYFTYINQKQFVEKTLVIENLALKLKSQQAASYLWYI